MNALRCTLVAACLAIGTPSVARAELGTATPGTSGFAPRVPVSALARPAFGFDASRLKVSTAVSVGSFGHQSTGLQTTSFSYQFQSPLWMNVSLGNAWGAGTSTGGNGSGSFFLQGVDFAYRPSQSFMIQVSYRDVRSPLQYQYDTPFTRAFDPYAR